MRARVVRIGNSKGIRLPKPLLDETGITEDVDLVVENNRIIIRPVLMTGAIGPFHDRRKRATP